MRLPVAKPRFELPELPLDAYIHRLERSTNEAERIGKSSGQGSEKFKRAFARLEQALIDGIQLDRHLRTPIDVRALGYAFEGKLWSKINFTPALAQTIERIRPKPSALFIDALYSVFLREFDRLPKHLAIANWLKQAKNTRGEISEFEARILSHDGPKWLAEGAQQNQMEFEERVRQTGLDRYASGRYLEMAKNIYFLQVLQSITPNEPHDILAEMQKESVYRSPYDDQLLLGHKILQIMIERAPASAINDAWRNVILAIGGDPRVPKSHAKYQKWWSQLDGKFIDKVRGWLSKLDLRLFLEALENFSDQSGNPDLKRMFPARKRFIEGLLERELVTGTRLYLSWHAKAYLKRTYEPEHLPEFSQVSDADKSIVHIQLGDISLIEGSHSCKLWIYGTLHPSAIVFNYLQRNPSYRDLTAGLHQKMRQQDVLLKDSIVHHPPLGWQNKAIIALRSLGLHVNPKDVLTADDYVVYKRRYGA